MSVVIRAFSIKEEGIKEKFEALIRVHWEEVQRKFVDEDFDLRWAMLEDIERVNLGGFIGAFVDGKLAGYYAMIIVPSFHTSIRGERLKVAQDLGWFVHPDYRSGSNIGDVLLQAAERMAIATGCRENSVSIKMLSRFARFLERFLMKRGYECSEHRLTKQLTGG